MKKMMFIIIMLFLSVGVVSGDVITLKSGKVVEGEIIQRTSMYVRIRVANSASDVREYLVDQIDNVVVGEYVSSVKKERNVLPSKKSKGLKRLSSKNRKGAKLDNEAIKQMMGKYNVSDSSSRTISRQTKVASFGFMKRTMNKIFNMTSVRRFFRKYKIDSFMRKNSMYVFIGGGVVVTGLVLSVIMAVMTKKPKKQKKLKRPKELKESKGWRGSKKLQEKAKLEEKKNVMMPCPDCSKTIPSKASKCHFCGKVLK